MDVIDRALRLIHLREAGPYSSAAVQAAEGQRIGADMLRCMAHEVDEADQLAKMQKAYNFWMQWVDMELAEAGTSTDELQPYLYESKDDPNANLGRIVLLEEKALKADNTITVKLIQPGWGTTGYYGEKILERHGPTGFPKGTKMYWDHPTETEAKERPERSLDDLAAELVTDAKFDRSGPTGPGLYANAKVFEAYKGPVDELAAHIGTSIRAFGAASEGEAEGRKGQIVESILPSVMNSIDFVTLPGAGGQVVSLFEAARGRHTDAGPDIPIQEATVGDQIKEPASPPTTPPSTVTPEITTVIQEAVRTATDPILQELKESKTTTARLQEVLILRDARDLVKEAIDRIPNVPEMTKTRLIESLSANPPVKDGVIDSEAFVTKITEAVQAELKYLSQAAGTARVYGMGGGSEPGGSPVPIEEAQKGLETALSRLGLTEKEAKIGVAGRAN